MPGIQRSQPAYIQVAAYVRELITSGQLKEGDKVPSANRLAEQFGVAVTITHLAVKVLVEEGLVRPESRRGTYVRPRSMWKINQDNPRPKKP